MDSQSVSYPFDLLTNSVKGQQKAGVKNETQPETSLTDTEAMKQFCMHNGRLRVRKRRQTVPDCTFLLFSEENV